MAKNEWVDGGRYYVGDAVCGNQNQRQSQQSTSRETENASTKTSWRTEKRQHTKTRWETENTQHW